MTGDFIPYERSAVQPRPARRFFIAYEKGFRTCGRSTAPSFRPDRHSIPNRFQQIKGDFSSGQRDSALKIPIYELSINRDFCHNACEGAIIMAKSARRYISELLEAYHQCTGKSYTQMALDFGVTLSNLYQYRCEMGNPTAETMDKIINSVETNCPKAFEKTSRW